MKTYGDISPSDITIFLGIFMLIFLWMKFRRPGSYPPGPTPMPLVGNLHNLSGEDMMKGIQNLRRQYGDIYSLSLGKFWVIVVNGMDNLRELLVKRGEHTSDRPALLSFNITYNKGIVNSSGCVWKHQRTFAVSKLRDMGFGKRSFQSNTLEELEIFLSYVESQNGAPFDITTILSASTSNVIMSMIIGRRFDYNDPKFVHFLKQINSIFNDNLMSGPFNFMPFLQELPGDVFGMKKLQKKADDQFQFFRDEINDHKRTFDENNIRDFTDIYLKKMREEDCNKDAYTEEDLLHVISDLFSAGAETTATVIRWAILYLINNMNIQERMVEEIKQAVGFNRLPNLSDKPKLQYCEAVILESLRLGNVLPFSLPHNVSTDIEYKGYIIPKNSIILPILDSVVHDESLYPDSFVFKPERFIDDDGKLFGQDKVLTFSLGRRFCLGETFAKMQLFLYLTAIVQRFLLLPPEGECAPKIIGHLGLSHSPERFEFRAVIRH